MSTTCGCEHCHSHGSSGLWMPTISFVLLVIGLIGKYSGISWFAESWIEAIWFLVAFLPVGLPVMREAWEAALRKDFFSEFSLMAIASIGAFCIGEYPEAVAVMLFYTVGERLQLLAVNKASKNISDLLDVRPERTDVWRTGTYMNVSPKDVKVGERIEVKPGGRVPLDGVLLEAEAQFDTSALTGESMPRSIREGEEVLAGMIVQGQAVRIQVNRPYEQSALARILALVKDASERKAPAELFIRRFARIYTPIVILLSFLIVSVPALVGMVTPSFQYVFSDWLYRGLVCLVISCPCALVISIPLGYFGGIGAASKNGILFKGSNFLDAIAEIKNVVMDKTGTMTEGVFKVQEVVLKSEFNKDEILKMVNALESQSTHPVATAIHQYVGEIDNSIRLDNTEEIAGHGLKANVNGKELLVGNFKLMDKFNISYDLDPTTIVYTLIAIAYDGKFAGYITIADSIKEDAQLTIDKLKALGVKTTMLSGDKSTVVKFVADKLGINNAFGDLLPEDKVNKVKEIKAQNETVAFVGDGVNDAPVVALSDVGIAMGGLGSDATIETADVVIQDDKPSKIPMAINIGKRTKKIVWQNIILAFAVKAIVLVLGAGGLATMWEAVFADVGVALLAILNAVRIQRMKF